MQVSLDLHNPDGHNSEVRFTRVGLSRTDQSSPVPHFPSPSLSLRTCPSTPTAVSTKRHKAPKRMSWLWVWPPLYGKHILDQPYLVGSFLAGLPYEMDPPYHHYAQSGLSVTYGRLDASEYCRIPVSGDNVGSTCEAVGGSFGFVSSQYTPRDLGHFNLGDLPLGVLVHQSRFSQNDGWVLWPRRKIYGILDAEYLYYFRW
jgi:hypothetical protein